MQIETERLLLRRWRDSDLAPFAEMNADAEVMEFFPSTLTAAESDAMVLRIEQAIDERGFGLLAIERKDTNEFIGFTGLSVPRFESHFTPCVEIGWRLHKQHWHQGFATEAALTVKNFALEDLQLGQIVSFTATLNLPSQRVMQRIGLTHNPADDFLHPSLNEGHPLRPHVLYRS